MLPDWKYEEPPRINFCKLTRKEADRQEKILSDIIEVMRNKIRLFVSK